MKQLWLSFAGCNKSRNNEKAVAHFQTMARALQSEPTSSGKSQRFELQNAEPSPSLRAHDNWEP